jgi:hypothetical protein
MNFLAAPGWAFALPSLVLMALPVRGAGAASAPYGPLYVTLKK